MPELPKQYNPLDHEEGIYSQWEKSGAFSPNQKALDEGKEPFVISLPPPNITGTLHLGHALQDTIMDILTRYHRMKGCPTLWQPGTDSAAIATNKVIEGQLHEEGTSRFKIGREEFMKRTEDWYAKTGAEILNQMKRLGCSCDWERGRFTLDDDYLHAVNETFIRYYEQGYLYRGSRIVNWDPKSQTTVSDLEIDWLTEKAPFYSFKYGPFEIGTSRPETKFGDKYVVMHPDDNRYAKYNHGDTFEAEWINGPIKATVIKDDAVDPKFGSGVMTITPWHDSTDFEIAQRHNLDMEQVIDFDGKLLPIADEFAGKSIEEARPAIVAKLEDKGLLVSIDEDYEHNIALNDRGKGTLEPQIMRQWFVDMSKLREATIEAAEKEMVKFIPPRWKKHFISWMENVYDWNINRQIWLGHRIPVWWKKNTHGTDNEEGNFVVSIEKPAEGEWEQDPDVLDTWFATALWPFAILGWPQETDDLKKFYPTSVLVTARDILYLWVARMVFSGLELMQGKEHGDRSPELRIPFKDVFIHPTVLAKDGRRMSKSLGTGIDPLELIEEHGADATRFGLMHQMSYDNQAIKFDETDVKSARNFANKIWNIARLLQSLPEQEESTVADQWIEQKLSRCQHRITELIETYKFGEAARLAYDFVWNDYADWYLEVLKVKGSTATANRVFEQILVLLHPFMPYVTEVIWQQTGHKELLITTSWIAPSKEQKEIANADVNTSMTYFQDVVSTVRSARALLSIPPSASINISLEKDTYLPEALSSLCRAELTGLSDKMKKFPLQGGDSVFIGSDTITEENIKAAQAKLSKEEEQLNKFIAGQEKSLESMRGKAPEDIILEKETALSQAQERLSEIGESKSLLS